MHEGHSTYTPKSGLGRWFDARLPLPRLVYDSFVAYPVPRNLNYAWTFGGILSIMLVAQILTGIVLAMHYSDSTGLAFDSVEKIMRDVNQGWLLRYLHSNGASFFFIAVYVHIFRGLYYGSYKAPREILWILGVIIFLVMMGTAFMVFLHEAMQALTKLVSGTALDTALNLKDNIAFLREMSIGLVIILFLVFEPDGLAHRWKQIKAYWKLYPFSH